MQKNEETVKYTSKDGITLSGTFTHAKKKSKSCVVMCHGLKTDRDEYGTFADLSNMLLDNGYDSFRFDFRAHGQSEGRDVEMTVQGLKKDLCATLGLLQNSGYSEIIVVGASFGASILSLINYAYFPQVKKIIVWSGSIDANRGNSNGSLGVQNYRKALENGSVNVESKTTGKIITLSDRFMRETRELAPEEKIKEINKPILFLQATEDETSPYEVNKNIAKCCKDAYFIEIEGASHGLHEPQYRKLGAGHMLNFLQMKKDKEKEDHEDR